MAALLNRRIKKFTLAANSWTNIQAPFDCNFYYIIGMLDGSGFDRCSDSTDSNTSYSIPAGYGYQFNTPWDGRGNYRFPVNSIADICRSVAGGTLIVEFSK